MDDPSCHIAILGGGLAGSLIALAMARHRPELRVRLIERGARLGGNHVWSFFASDLADDPAGEPAGDLAERSRALVEPLIAARWDGYDVHFPGFSRRLAAPYASVTSARLDTALRAALPPSAILTGSEVRGIDGSQVLLADGRTIGAGAIIDARGAGALPHMAGGWQKFAGQLLRTRAPHGLERPVVMDARVEQVGGYRFVYALPFSPDTVFVEDTYYADDPALDLPVLRERIAAYAQGSGWQVEAVEYEETGVLPVIAAGDFEAFWAAGDCGADLRAGARAALIHPLTSYSFPDAVRFAMYLTTLDKFSGIGLGRAGHAWAANHWRGGRYYRMLTRMLFAAAPPEARWRVLERFYRLPEPLVERFYAGRSTLPDRARLLAGRPPVPLGAALASLLGGGRPLADLGPEMRKSL